MKWIKVSDGHHKLVPDSDPRPEDKEFANRPTRPGIPFTTTKPSWAVFEPAMHSSDPNVQKTATDMFLATREREMQTSRRARLWEQDRKASWAKDKPQWRKKQQTNA